jgi:ribonuclease VapC
MILDASAVVAVILDQAGAYELVRKLDGAGCAMGAPSITEAAIVLQARLGDRGMTDLRAFLVEFDVEVVPFGDEHWRQAASAFARFGKGRHPAALNLGDCLTYAIAKLSGQPLLCVGGDFAQTDLELVPLQV